MTERKVIVQISDLHLVGEGLLAGRVDPAANLARALDQLGRSAGDPDVLVLSGDLADRGEPAAYRCLRRLVDGYAGPRGVPVLYLPGNHDRRAPFREHLLGREASDEPVDQVCWVGGLRLVALDSTVPGHAHGALRDAQLAWLDAELARPAPGGSIVVLHHPPVPGPVAVLNEIGLREPERLAAVLAGRGVLMVLAGHAHHTSAGLLAGIPVWVSAASAYRIDVLAGADGRVRGLPGSAFTRVDVTGLTAVATNVPVAGDGPAVYEVGSDDLRRRLTASGSL